jgi:hypothetical protein
MARPTVQGKSIRIVDFSRGSSIESYQQPGHGQQAAGVSKPSKESKDPDFARENSLGLELDMRELNMFKENLKGSKKQQKGAAPASHNDLMVNNFTSLESSKAHRPEPRSQAAHNTIQQTLLTSRERRKQTLLQNSFKLQNFIEEKAQNEVNITSNILNFALTIQAMKNRKATHQ